MPVELIDDMSNNAGGLMSGLEKHIAGGGSLPMVTAESLENVGKTAKFGGPALSFATTVFDMAMADSGRDRCIAAVAGAGGFGGGWGRSRGRRRCRCVLSSCRARLGANLAAGGAILGGFYGADLGKFVGEIVCPY